MGISGSKNKDKTKAKKSMENMEKGVKGIKSSYIISKIFSNLDEIRKLNLIRHSNHFQKVLSIDIEYYMKMSGRYKVEGINGNGKEYKIGTDDLLFEGEYLNGKRHGKGKEYLHNHLIFEGEYLNGKRHGKGKEFNIFDKVIFEGEYLNGKRWNGKFINRESIHIWDLRNFEKKEINIDNFDNFDSIESIESDENNGDNNNNDKKDNNDNIEVNNKDEKIRLFEIKNGKGIIKKYDEDRLIFEGEYLNGELNGKGKEYFHYGYYDRDDGRMIYYGEIIIFEGEYLNGKKWNGKGYDVDNKIACEIKNGKGNIKSYYDSGKLHSECEILNGERNGKCKVYRYRELQLEFEWIYFNDKKWNGKEYDDYNHLIYEGEYLNDERWKGRVKEYTNKDKLLSEGEYLNGKKWNEKAYDNEGNIVSEIINGEKNFEIKKNKYHEWDNTKIIYEKNYISKEGFKKGKEYNMKNVLLYEGEFLNSERNGKGKEYDEYHVGRLIYEGEFLDGKRDGKGKKYDYEGDLEFEGEFYNGKIWNGYGRDGCFEGEFRNGKIYNTSSESKNNIIKNGEGYVKFYRYGELIYEGEYKNGDKNGKGKEYFNKRLEFEGEYKDGEKVKGKQYSFTRGYDGKLLYDGEFALGGRRGQGKEYDLEGNVIFEGEFHDGEWINGKRKIYDNNNQLISEELYVNGKRVIT